MAAPSTNTVDAVLLEVVKTPHTKPARDPELTKERQLTLATTMLAYCALIFVGVTQHEPWADEAQSWLLSRDLGYRYLVFHQLRYDGVPPLWPTILWIANHIFHLPYQSQGWIAGLCAIAGCWFFCRYSPFPAAIRILFPFTYFIAFQYAIVARPYVLLPLCASVAAHYFSGAEHRPWRFVFATSMLALLCAPALMLAIGLVASSAWYILRKWADISTHDRRQLIAVFLVFFAVLVFVAYVNWPPPDHSFARSDRPGSDGNFGLATVPQDVSVAFFGSAISSFIFLIVVGIWCAYRRRLLPLVLPVVLVLAFFIKVYVNRWHCGTLTIAAVAALWIAWPRQGEILRGRVENGLRSFALAALVALFAVHIYWTARTLKLDHSGAYSGSLDAANYLRSVGANATSTCGFEFHSVAIQPYFRQSIFQNWPKGESFWRWENTNRVDQNCFHAKWIVIPICCRFDNAKELLDRNDSYLRSMGYAPVHVSRGSMYFAGRSAEPTDFVVYRSLE